MICCIDLDVSHLNMRLSCFLYQTTSGSALRVLVRRPYSSFPMFLPWPDHIIALLFSNEFWCMKNILNELYMMIVLYGNTSMRLIDEPCGTAYNRAICSHHSM